MQCAQIQKMLANYALDDARVTERLCVDVHVAHCSGCRKELEDLCELIAACDRAFSHPDPSCDFDALMMRIEAGGGPARDLPVRARWDWRTLATRAAAAAAVVAAVLITAPVARNAGHVVRDLREVSSDRAVPKDDPVEVPVVSEPFVKRALDLKKEGFETVEFGQPEATGANRLP